MLLPSKLSKYSFQYNNWGTNPSATIGTSVTPGASNAEGTFTQIASSANIAQDCYWLHIYVHTGNTSAASKPHLLDIGVDPAGGTSYTAIISNIACGQSASVTGAGVREFLFPFFIKAGSSVAARIQGANATAGTVRVAAVFYGQPSHPQNVPIGNISQTFGTITNSSGPTVTPGNAADGSWVDLGATSTALWWFQPCVQVDNGTITPERCFIEVAYGDGSNKHIMFKIMNVGTAGETGGTVGNANLLACAAYNPVPSGVNIYVRGRCENAPDTGYNATVIGIGG